MSLRRWGFLAAGLVLPMLCLAQAPGLEGPSLAALQRQAVESVDITVGPFMLWIARHFAPERDSQGGNARAVLRGVHKVQVHNYRFNSANGTGQPDLEALRSQLAATGWHPLVKVRDRSNAENVDVFYVQTGDAITQLTILASHPSELTLVHILGDIDLNQVAMLRGDFVR